MARPASLGGRRGDDGAQGTSRPSGPLARFGHGGVNSVDLAEKPDSALGALRVIADIGLEW